MLSDQSIFPDRSMVPAGESHFIYGAMSLGVIYEPLLSAACAVARATCCSASARSQYLRNALFQILAAGGLVSSISPRIVYFHISIWSALAAGLSMPVDVTPSSLAWGVSTGCLVNSEKSFHTFFSSGHSPKCSIVSGADLQYLHAVVSASGLILLTRRARCIIFLK